MLASIGSLSIGATISTTGRSDGAPDDRGPIHGKDAMRAYVQDWIDTFDEFWIEPVELIDAGQETSWSRLMRYGGRAKLSGIETGSRPSGSCSRFATERSRVAGSTRPATRPSKPPGCRSSPLDEKH